MEQEIVIVNKLYLELSQIATAKTEREINLERKIKHILQREKCSDCENECDYVTKWKDAASDLGKCFTDTTVNLNIQTALADKYAREVIELKSRIKELENANIQTDK